MALAAVFKAFFYPTVLLSKSDINLNTSFFMHLFIFIGNFFVYLFIFFYFFLTLRQDPPPPHELSFWLSPTFLYHAFSYLCGHIYIQIVSKKKKKKKKK